MAELFFLLLFVFSASSSSVELYNLCDKDQYFYVSQAETRTLFTIVPRGFREGKISSFDFGNEKDIYATDSRSNVVYRFDSKTGINQEVFISDRLYGPSDIRYHAGLLYITNEISHEIIVINTTTKATTSFFSSVNQVYLPKRIAVSDDVDDVSIFVLSSINNGLYLCTTFDQICDFLTTVGEPEMGQVARDLVYSPPNAAIGGTIILSIAGSEKWNGYLVQYDIRKRHQADHIKQFVTNDNLPFKRFDPSGLAVGPDLRIYVQDSYSGVHVFDLTGRYRRTIVEAVHQVHAEIFCNSIGILRFWQSRVNFLLYTISNPSIPLRERNLPVS